MQSGLFVCLLIGLALGVQARANQGFYHQHAENLIPIAENVVSPRFDVIQSLSDIINQIAQSIMITADDLDAQIVEVFDPVVPELFKTLEDGNKELAEIYAEFEDTQKRGVGACIDELLEKVRAILINGKQEVGQCVQTSTNQVLELRAELERSVAAIKEEVDSIKNVISACKESDGTVRCILDNLKQLLASAGKIILEAVSTAVETRRTVRAIVSENLQCVSAAVVKARKAVLEARIEAIECAGGFKAAITNSVAV